jgi:hypothetical protein
VLLILSPVISSLVFESFILISVIITWVGFEAGGFADYILDSVDKYLFNTR